MIKLWSKSCWQFLVVTKSKVSRSTGLLLLLVAFCGCLPSSVFAQTIGPGHSGAWYDPVKDGQGFTIQIISESVALMTWFTFDTQGNQKWIQGVGEIAGKTIEFDDLYLVEGPKFGPNFDPDDRVVTSKGTLSITFDDCAAGVARYSGARSLPSETLQLQRLTYLADFSCGERQPAALTGVFHKGLSGAWFDPSQDGQGWMIEVLSDEALLIFWFTYDQNGNQAWMLGVGEIENNGFISFEMYQPTGAKFGPDFDPADVQMTPWGALAMSHVQCGRAVAYYESFDGTEQGWYRNVGNLVTIGGADPCDFSSGLAKIEGELTAAPNSFVDGTTNDPNSTLVLNNALNQTQRAGNPTTITGFVSAEPVSSGRYTDVEDPWDVYRIPLIAGQTVQLIIADWDSSRPGKNDLDLFLFELDTGDVIDASVGTGRNEYIEVLETGIYNVAVNAFAGSSAYTLHVSYTTAPASASAQALRLGQEFVENELLVGLDRHGVLASEEDATSSKTAAQVLQSLSDQFGLSVQKEAEIGPVLVSLSGKSSQFLTQQAKISEARYFLATGPLRAVSDASVLERLQTLYAAKAIGLERGVTYAHPNFVVHASSNDPRRSDQWHYDAISLNPAWTVTRGDPQVVVAVIDTGVAPHPDLLDNIRYDLGYDAIDFAQNLGPSALPGDDITFAQRRDRSSHGTHVAGTVAAAADNRQYGTGVAPNASIMPIRVLRNGSGSFSGIISGIYWAAGRSTNSSLNNPSRRADIINLSLGAFGGCSDALQEAIDFAVSQGVIVIAAAGNSTTSMAQSPASCQGVVSVAATNRQDNPAFYSNCGGSTWVAAPGGETASSRSSFFTSGPFGFPMLGYRPFNTASCRTDPNTLASTFDGVWSTDVLYSDESRFAMFEAAQGTSMAAPHVAGVAALMKSADPSLDPRAFFNLLADGRLTRRPDDQPWDPELGYGIIDAALAVNAVTDRGQERGVLLTTPNLLSFGQRLDSRLVRISPSGNGIGQIDAFFNDGHSWLRTATAIQTDNDGFGLYRIGIDRADLIEGEYRGTFTVVSSEGVSATIRAEMRVGEADQAGDAGFLYLILYDALTGEVVDLLGGSGFQGQYTYEVTDLVPGEYFLFAFSNVSFSGEVCRAGDLCGFYPGTGPLEPINISAGGVVSLPTITVRPDTTGLGEAGQAQASEISYRETVNQEQRQSVLGAPLRLQVEGLITPVAGSTEVQVRDTELRRH